MKRFSTLTVLSILTLVFGLAGCAAAPSKVSNDQIKKLQDKIDQLEQQIDGAKGQDNQDDKKDDSKNACKGDNYADVDGTCESDCDCIAGSVCDVKQGLCGMVPPGKHSVGGSCDVASDCLDGLMCEGGTCAASSSNKNSLTLENLAGTWKATSFVETQSSGKQVSHLKDPKDSLILVIKSNGELTWKSVDGWTGDTSDDTYQIAIVSPTSLKITKSDTQTFAVAYSANSMTWKKYPWGSSTVDFTFERVGQ